MNLINYFFPKQCLNCSRFGEYLCSSCEHRYIKRSLHQLCHVCKRETNKGELVHRVCQSTTNLDGVVVCCKYNKLVEKLVAELKYNFYIDIANYLVKYYIDSLNYLDLQRSNILSPVPLFPRKERARGFNQANLISQKIADQAHLKCRSLLIRTKNTKTQVGMGRAERIKNLENVFEAKINGPEKVVLVDDIMTTGTTLEECAQALKNADTKKVYAIVFARG